MSARAVDLIGQRFGRLVVLGRAPAAADRRTRWICRCDCGETSDVAAYDLRHSITRSCGCLRREHLAACGQQFAERLQRKGRFLRDKVRRGLVDIRDVGEPYGTAEDLPERW